MTIYYHPNDGGPAFPAPLGSTHNTGMSLRDWFAGQALSRPHGATAAQAYAIADQMLAERTKGRKEKAVTRQS